MGDHLLETSFELNSMISELYIIDALYIYIENPCCNLGYKLSVHTNHDIKTFINKISNIKYILNNIDKEI